MKNFFLSLLLSFLVFGALAQKNSRNNYLGNWESNSTWVDGTAAQVATICCLHHNIFGNVTRFGDLTFANAYDHYNFYVHDTLAVTGNMIFGNKSMDLRVPAKGILVVFGDFISDNKIVVENGGILIVKNNMYFNGGNKQSTYSSPGHGALYVGGTVTGNNTANSEKKPLSDLPPDLYKFVMQDPGSGNYTPLPIELLYFRARNNAAGIRLEWASAKEWDFSHYSIERSENGKDFFHLHTMYGDGMSNQPKTYSYLDEQPFFGANYYRLKATDLDGAEEIKSTALVYFGVAGNLKIFPNPAHAGTFTLHYPGAGEGSWVEIKTLSGLELMKVQMTEEELKIAIPGLAPGIYLIQVSNHYEVKQAKLIVQ